MWPKPCHSQSAQIKNFYFLLPLPWKCEQHPCVLSPNTSSCLPSLLHYSLSLLKKTAEIWEKRAKRGKNNFYTLLPSSVYRTDSPPSALHVAIFLLQCIWYYICCFFSNHHDNDRRANWVLPPMLYVFPSASVQPVILLSTHTDYVNKLRPYM